MIFISYLLILIFSSTSNEFVLPNNNQVKNQLLNQQHTSATQTCPCVKPQGSSECIKYDDRYQAATLDEAMFNFIDLSSNSPNPNPMVSPSPEDTRPQPSSRIQPRINVQLPESNYSCTSRQCQACKLRVVNGFVQSSDNGTGWWQLQQRMIHEIGPTGGGGNLQTYIQQPRCNQCPDGSTNCHCDHQDPQNENIANQMIRLLNSVQPTRNKRQLDNSVTNQSTNNNQSVLGVSTTISCDYQRGEALWGDSPWCGLCSLCWSWRSLPDNYFPSFINEVNCDNADNGCLADFGECRPVYRTISIMKNFGSPNNPNWEQQSISIIDSCECQVEVGTPLHSFITK